VKARKKATTVRLPAGLYQAGSEIARRRQVSLNQLLEESLEATVKADERRRLYEAFGRVGREAAAADVEFALEAQVEALEDDAG